MHEVGIADVSGYVPAYRLDDYLTRETASSPDVSVPGPDEDAFTLMWASLTGLPRVEAEGPVLLRVPDSDIETRALVAHARATGVLGEPAAVVPLAPDAGVPDLLALAARLAQPGLGLLVDHRRPAGAGAPATASAAAAVRFGPPRVARVAAVAARHTLTFDRWRTGPAQDQQDARFVEEALVAVEGDALLAELLKASGRTTADLAGVVVTCGARLRGARWAKRWEVPSVWQAGGGAGGPGASAAHALLTALDRLRAAGPDGAVAILDLGWGGGGAVLTAGTDAAQEPAKPTATTARGTKAYGLAAWHGRATEAPGPWTSPAELWREMPALLGPTGYRCDDCGGIGFPRAGVCELCGSFEVADQPLRRTGVVATHSVDHLFDSSDPVQMVVVDLDGGGRFFGQAVRDVPRRLAVGDRVRLVLRRLHTASGLPHYFWKVDLDG